MESVLSVGLESLNAVPLHPQGQSLVKGSVGRNSWLWALLPWAELQIFPERKQKVLVWMAEEPLHWLTAV